MAEFSLKKWYLGVADEKGNVYIGYRADLEWGAFAMSMDFPKSSIRYSRLSG